MEVNKFSLTRRDLLRSLSAFGASFVVGGSFLASSDASWALEVKHIRPDTMATLVQMARDIYPHDRVSTEFYVGAVKGYDTPDSASMIEEGIAELNRVAGGSYVDIGWEIDRVAVLEQIEASDFFQMVRGNLVTGLYNQKGVWGIFGYEGDSYNQGGYIDRGFDDINWL